MGWCSGTHIFDDVAKFILKSNLEQTEKIEVLTGLAEALEDLDWDCQSDSFFYDDPVVKVVFKQLHPTWFDE